MSVDIGRLTSVTTILQGHEGYAVASFTAKAARDAGLAVVSDPLPDNPAHAVVVGNKTGSRRKALVKACTWIVAPSA